MKVENAELMCEFEMEVPPTFWHYATFGSTLGCGGRPGQSNSYKMVAFFGEIYARSKKYG